MANFAIASLGRGLHDEAMGLEENLRSVRARIDAAARVAGRDYREVSLVAISKGQSVEKILELYRLGVRDFGENRVHEALEKMESLPSDIRWHFVGRLQKNKVSKVIGRFALIHSVDTLELGEKIAQSSVKAGVCTPILLQANTSGEVTKSGLSPVEWEACYDAMLAYEGIDIRGCMTMAPLLYDAEKIHSCFAELRYLAHTLQKRGGRLSTLSMGMSQDFAIAIQEGSTLVRIGAAIFNESQ